MELGKLPNKSRFSDRADKSADASKDTRSGAETQPVYLDVPLPLELILIALEDRLVIRSVLYVIKLQQFAVGVLSLMCTV